MRVLHVHKVNGIGGSERHLLSLLPGLVDAGLDVRMCVLGDAGAGDFVSRLDERGVPRDDLSVSGYWRRGDDEEGYRVFKQAERAATG